MNFFERFGQVWGKNGLLDNPTLAQADAGWLYIGQAPPTVEQFNSTHQWWDEKDNWLYGQIATVITAASLIPAPDDPTLLWQALQWKFDQYVLKRGDSMTGVLQMFNAGNGITWASPTSLHFGSWYSNVMGFGWDGSRLRVKVDGTDVGWIQLNFTIGDYVRRSGDTMTGSLVNQQTVQAAYLYSTGSIAAAANVTGNYFNSNNLDVNYNINAAYIHSRGDIRADATVHGSTLHAFGDVRADNYLIGSYLLVYGNSDLRGYTNIRNSLDVDSNINCTNLWARNDIYAGDKIQAPYLVATGNVHAYGPGYFDGNILVVRTPPGSHGAVVSSFDLTDGRGYGFFGDLTGIHWVPVNWDGSIIYAQELMRHDVNKNMFVYGGVWAALGFYAGSDPNTKTNITNVGRTTDSLFGLSKINLISYDDANTNHHSFGFDASNIKEVFPELIKPYQQDADNYDAFEVVGMIAHCVNAIRQLNDKINALAK